MFCKARRAVREKTLETCLDYSSRAPDNMPRVWIRDDPVCQCFHTHTQHKITATPLKFDQQAVKGRATATFPPQKIRAPGIEERHTGLSLGFPPYDKG